MTDLEKIELSVRRTASMAFQYSASGAERNIALWLIKLADQIFTDEAKRKGTTDDHPGTS